MSAGYEPKRFDEKTTLEEIMAAYEERKKAYGKQALKVGVVKKEGFDTRYHERRRYMRLDSSSIFAESSSSVAIKIEPILMKILNDDGACVNSCHESVEPDVRGTDCNAIIYVTQLKADLYRCPISKCDVILELKYVEEHAKSHPYYRMMSKHVGRYQAQDIHVPQWLIDSLQPFPYRHRVWRSTDCEHCGAEFESGVAAASHRSLCSENKIGGFICFESGCGHKSASLDDFQKHERMHAKKIALATRPGRFSCGVCSAKFDDGKKFRRHVRTHEAPKHSCPHCGGMFSRPDGVVRHMKKFAPGSKQCPTPN